MTRQVTYPVSAPPGVRVPQSFLLSVYGSSSFAPGPRRTWALSEPYEVVPERPRCTHHSPNPVACCSREGGYLHDTEESKWSYGPFPSWGSALGMIGPFSKKGVMIIQQIHRMAQERAVKTAPGGPAGHNVRLRGQGCVPTRVGGFCGGTPSRRGFNRPLPHTPSLVSL